MLQNSNLFRLARLGVLASLIGFLLTGCEKELEFEQKVVEKKTALPCKGICPHVILKLPVAKNGGFVSDSINNKMFATLKQIIFFGEHPYDAKNYDELAADFMQSYEKTQKDNPDDLFGWEGEVTGKLIYSSEKLLNIELTHYTFTGGAHGYSGKTSLIFDKESGRSLEIRDLFKDLQGFTKLAEKAFRTQHKIPENLPINSGGLMFENQIFQLPQTVFLTKKGILLYYNPYEIASYAEGPQQVLIPYSQADAYLAQK